MFCDKELFSDLGQGDLLAVDLGVIHPALELVVDGWVYRVALLVVFLL
jgi:hypothetical protein